MNGVLREADNPLVPNQPPLAAQQPQDQPNQQLLPQPVAAEQHERVDAGDGFDDYDVGADLDAINFGCDYQAMQKKTAQRMVQLKSQHKVSSNTCNKIYSAAIEDALAMYNDNPYHFRANAENALKVANSTHLQRKLTNSLPLKIQRTFDKITKNKVLPDIYYIPLYDTLRRLLALPGVLELIKADHSRKFWFN